MDSCLRRIEKILLDKFMPTPIRIPRILITNDDGIDAPGLTLLHDIAAGMADEVWVVAPETDQSGMGQSLTITKPLRLHQRNERTFVVSGTPADCVTMALGHFLKDHRPNLLLSGVNSGVNLGDEINLSGTVGAALTGLMLGVPSIAISQQYHTRTSINWEPARTHVPVLLQHFLSHGWRRDTCLSINIPDLPSDMIRDFAWTRAGHKNINSIKVEQRTDYREQNYFWLALKQNPDVVEDEECDSAALRRGQISVVSLSLDRSLSLGRAPVSLKKMTD
jgi:5'-nucleotidase